MLRAAAEIRWAVGASLCAAAVVDTDHLTAVDCPAM
jgi:hypothetical protein